MSFPNSMVSKIILITTNFNDNNKINNSKIKKLIADINLNMNMQIINGNKMLTHYMIKYGHIPLWVLVRIITFGQISKFYEFMKQQDQNKIAKNFGIREKELKTHIHNLAIIRNICAHDEKLYDIRLKNTIMQNEIHKQLDLKLENEKHSNGYKDLFSIVIILPILLDEEEFKKFYNAIIDIIKELKNNISSINFSEILDRMGFMYNYDELFIVN